ncbi:MAG: hypothetical protein O7C66_06095 [Alphaproteobacteria bacterium]|nr:hypothetical protein [Alphaproteobacteria bacterium]
MRGHPYQYLTIPDPSVTILFLGPTGHRSRSRTFTIHAEARTLAGGRFARRAVVRMAGRGDTPFRILAWGGEDEGCFRPPHGRRHIGRRRRWTPDFMVIYS